MSAATAAVPASTSVPGLTLTCIEVRRETPAVKTFRFRASRPLAFVPGQAMMLGIDAPGGRLWRSFSISGSDAPGEVEMTIKAQAEGGATRWLHDALKPGMALAARPPRGAFTLEPRTGGPLAFVSGGSGATPLLAMLRALSASDPGADVAWVHAAGGTDEILFAGALAGLQARMPHLAVSVAVSRPGPGWYGYRGRIGRRLLSVMVPDLARRDVFCCGPPAFMGEVRLIHAAEGGAPARFHTESFGAPPMPVRPAARPDAAAGPEPGFRLRAAGRDLAIRAGETVLQASLRQGVVIPCGCGEGLCGTCMVKLEAGSVALHHQGGITPEEEAEGYILACSSRPITDLAITIG